ncbi:Organic cation transporter protein [Nymphon striatum]|nr:Organic cation transporter protein [Nymphon striatum]
MEKNLDYLVNEKTGWWQRLVLISMTSSVVIVAQQNLAMPFFAPLVDHWCSQPKHLGKLPANSWKNYSIPVEKASKSGKKTYSSCNMFNVDYENVSVSDYVPYMMRLKEENVIFSDNSCSSWSYDESEWRETIVFDNVNIPSSEERFQMNVIKQLLLDTYDRFPLPSLQNDCLRLRFKSKSDPSFLPAFCIARNAYYKHIRNAKRLHGELTAEKLTQDAQQNGIRSLYRHAKSKRSTSAIPLHNLLDYSIDLFSSNSPAPELYRLTSCRQQEHFLLSPVSLQEVESTLKGARNDKLMKLVDFNTNRVHNIANILHLVTYGMLCNMEKHLDYLVNEKSGWWQRLVLISMTLVVIIIAPQHLAMPFFAPSVDHWCSQPKHLEKLSAKIWKNYSIPVEKTSGSGKKTYSSCDMFNVDYENVSVSDYVPYMMHLKAENESFSDNSCSSWSYDESIWKETIVFDWNLVCDRSVLVSVSSSVYMAGMVFGLLILPHFSDKIGRRPVILFCLVTWFTTGLGIVFSPNYVTFTVLRFFTAAVSEFSIDLAYVIGQEGLSQKVRSTWGNYTTAGFSIGVIILTGLAYYLRNWRLIQIISTIPLIIMFFLHLKIPESVRWQLSVGRYDEAVKSLKKCAELNNYFLPDDSVLQDDIEQMKRVQESKKSRENENKPTIFDLFKTKEIRIRTLISYFLWFSVSFCYYAFSLNIGDMAGNMFVNMIIGSSLEIVGVFIGSYMLVKFGRKRCLASLMFFAGALLLLAIPIPASISWLKVSISLLGRTCISMVFAMLYIHTGEYMPTVLRAIGIGSCNTCARLGSIIAPYAHQIKELTSETVVFIIYGVLCILCGIAYLRLPETLNCPLPESIEDAENLSSSQKRNCNMEKHLDYLVNEKSGWWQRLVLISMTLVVIIAAPQHLAMPFFAPSVDHWCSQPKHLERLSAKIWKNYSIPVEKTSGSGKKTYSSCDMFNVDYENVSVSDYVPYMMHLKEENESFSDNSCSSWSYDESKWKETIVFDDQSQSHDSEVINCVNLINKRLVINAVPSIFPNCPSYMKSEFTNECSASRGKSATTEGRQDRMNSQLQENIQNFWSEDSIKSIEDVYQKLETQSGYIPIGFTWILQSEKLLILSIVWNDAVPRIVGSITLCSSLSISITVNGGIVAPQKFKHITSKEKLENFDTLRNLMAAVKNWIVISETDCSELLDKAKDSLEKYMDKCEGIEKQKQCGFLREQIGLLESSKKSRRYSPDCLISSYLLYAASPNAYEEFRKQNLLCLPSSRTLRSLTSIIKANESKYLKSRFSNLNSYERHVILMIDEIYTASRVEYSSSEGKIIGLTTDNNVAGTILTFMISSIAGQYRDVVSFYPINVLCVDNHPVNRAFLTNILCNGSLKSQIKNPVNDKPLFLLFDPVHNIKNVYNNFQGKRIFKLPSFHLDNLNFVTTAKFDDLCELHNLEATKPIKLGYKLTEKCLNPTSIEKSSVKLSMSVFNESTENALRFYSDHENKDWIGTATFISHFLKLWSIINVKNKSVGKFKRDPYREPITTVTDGRLTYLYDFANFLKRWQQNKKFCLTKETFTVMHHMCVTLPQIACYFLDVLKFQYVLFGKFQSDMIESRFGWYRQLSGGNYFISVKQVLESERKIKAVSLLKFSGLNALDDFDKHDCVQLSENEVECFVLQMQDYEMAKLDSGDMNAIYYVAGALVRSMLKRTNCVSCKIFLVDDKRSNIDELAADKFEIVNDDVKHFVEAVNRGGLLAPSSLAFDISWNLVCDRSVLVSVSSSVYMAGMVFGLLILPHFSDKIGRKPVILFCLVTWFTTGLSIAFSPNYVTFTVLRFFTAAVNVFSIDLAFVIGQECLSQKVRSTWGNYTSAGFSIGVIILTGLAYYLRNWRLIQIISTIPLTIMFFLHLYVTLLVYLAKQ